MFEQRREQLVKNRAIDNAPLFLYTFQQARIFPRRAARAFLEQGTAQMNGCCWLLYLYTGTRRDCEQQKMWASDLAQVYLCCPML